MAMEPNDGDKLSADFLRGALFGVHLLARLTKATLATVKNPVLALALAFRASVDALEKRSQYEQLREMEIAEVG